MRKRHIKKYFSKICPRTNLRFVIIRVTSDVLDMLVCVVKSQESLEGLNFILTSHEPRNKKEHTETANLRQV